MISRRNIRVKVMQTIYTFTTADTESADKQKSDGSALLNDKLSRSLDLFLIAILYTLRVAQYAEKDAGKRATKYLPTAEDLNVNTKIAGNEFLWKILDNPSFKEKIKDSKIDQYLEQDWIKKIYLKLVQSPEYKSYISTGTREYKDEVNIIRFIWEKLMLENEDLMDHFSDELPDWDDDIDMTAILMHNLFKNQSKINFLNLVSGEKREYAHDLLHSTIDKEEYTGELIQPKLKNWDADRVALIDMILLKMGVTELLYFPSIPTKVTINEYIEVAKSYSTPQSGQFVNGVLDNILKDLTKENKIHKEERQTR